MNGRLWVAHEMVIVIYGEDIEMQSIFIREYIDRRKMHLIRKRYKNLRKLEN